MTEIADVIAWLRHANETRLDPAGFWEDDPDHEALHELATLQAGIVESVTSD